MLKYVGNLRKNNNKLSCASENLANKFPGEEYVAKVMSTEFEELKTSVFTFAQREAERKPTFALWLSYIEMLQTLLSFLRATQENNWDLHLSAVRSMLPWFFATDRILYARYGTVYWLEMLCLETSHPGDPSFQIAELCNVTNLS